MHICPRTVVWPCVCAFQWPELRTHFGLIDGSARVASPAQALQMGAVTPFSAFPRLNERGAFSLKFLTFSQPSLMLTAIPLGLSGTALE